MIEFKKEPSKNLGNVLMSGALCIDQAEQIKNTLLNALNETDHIVIIFKENTEVDISVLQLIYSAKITSAKMEKTFALKKSFSHALKGAFEDSGYTSYIGAQ